MELRWRPRQRLTIGVGATRSAFHFVQSSQFGYLDPQRGVIEVDGPGAFADGTQESEDSLDSRVDLGGRTTTWSAWLSDSLALTPALRLTLAGRYDRTSPPTRLTDDGGGPGSQDGDHDFDRSIRRGVEFADSPACAASRGQSSRARRIELAARIRKAMPPAKSMAGEPPLAQVVATSIEGVRRRASGTAELNVFSTNARIFRRRRPGRFGYFATSFARRQASSSGCKAKRQRLTWGANYTTRATCRSSEESTGATSSMTVRPGFEQHRHRAGKRCPWSAQIAKLFLEWTSCRNWEWAGCARRHSIARGTRMPGRNRRLYYLEQVAVAVRRSGPGVTAPAAGLDVYLQVDNLLDRNYETASQLGATGFTSAGNFVSRPFDGPVIDGERPMRNSTYYAPGAPRSYVLGVRWRFTPAR